VWQAPQNERLRGERESRNVLSPGDILVIPDKREKTEPAATGRVVVASPPGRCWAAWSAGAARLPSADGCASTARGAGCSAAAGGGDAVFCARGAVS
jgi:hypothetical protein